MLHIEVRRVYKRSHCFGFFIDSVWESNIQSHHLALVSTPVLLVGMDGICYCQNNISQKNNTIERVNYLQSSQYVSSIIS
jgi:hypothetical protein